MDSEGLSYMLDKVSFLVKEPMRSRALQANQGEVFSARWVRICLDACEPRKKFKHWPGDTVTNDSHIFLHAIHGTTETGAIGISSDCLLRPGSGSDGFGPVVCAFGATVENPYDGIKSPANRAKALDTVTRAADSSKHRCPVLFELMMTCRLYVHRGSSHEAKAQTQYHTGCVHYVSSHNKVWTLPAALSSPSAFWIDMHKIHF